MPKKVSIGGLIVTPHFCKKLNTRFNLFTFFEVFQQPLINIYNIDTFIINDLVFIDNNLEKTEELCPKIIRDNVSSSLRPTE